MVSTARTGLENYAYLNNRKLGIPSHDRVIVVSRVPEDQISSLVRFPGMDQSNITCNSRFQNIPTTIEDASVLPVTGNLYTTCLTTRVVLNGNSTRFYHRASTGRGIDSRVSCSVGVDSGNESTLGNKFDADIAVKVGSFNKLISIKGKSG